ncbi:MAG TPA: hypothetical protein EYH24_06760 [Thermococcus paralvinellae]|uniref:Uncharacterized protein n=1 Tax=Thermococcus paralvinellae TaxID=582419 RepID=A0A832ZGR7_9EURY|nr:hypothetical protein [Thermococcus paralvinellae]
MEDTQHMLEHWRDFNSFLIVVFCLLSDNKTSNNLKLSNLGIAQGKQRGILMDVKKKLDEI